MDPHRSSGPDPSEFYEDKEKARDVRYKFDNLVNANGGPLFLADCEATDQTSRPADYMTDRTRERSNRKDFATGAQDIVQEGLDKYHAEMTAKKKGNAVSNDRTESDRTSEMIVLQTTTNRMLESMPAQIAAALAQYRHEPQDQMVPTPPAKKPSWLSNRLEALNEHVAREFGFYMSLAIHLLPALALTYLVATTRVVGYYANLNPDLAHAAAYFTIWMPTAALLFRFLRVRVESDPQFRDAQGNLKNQNVFYLHTTLQNFQTLAKWATIFVFAFDVIWMTANWAAWLLWNLGLAPHIR